MNHMTNLIHMNYSLQECGMDKCPIDGVWGEWGPWEECVDGKQVSAAFLYYLGQKYCNT